MVAPLRYGHRSIVGDHSLRRCTAANLLDATSGYRMQIRARSKRNLTLSPRMCSVKPIMVGDELKVINSGGSLREELGRLA
jgi:hypothetical protein